MSSNATNQSQPESILLVHTAEHIRTQIAESLADAGFRAICTHCPDQARQQLAAEPFAAVLIAQAAAPNELAAFCRDARSADAQLAIVPALANADDSLGAELLALGADDVVTDAHAPEAIAKRLAVRIADRKRIS